MHLGSLSARTHGHGALSTRRLAVMLTMLLEHVQACGAAVLCRWQPMRLRGTALLWLQMLWLLMLWLLLQGKL